MNALDLNIMVASYTSISGHGIFSRALSVIENLKENAFKEMRYSFAFKPFSKVETKSLPAIGEDVKCNL